MLRYLNHVHAYGCECILYFNVDRTLENMCMSVHPMHYTKIVGNFLSLSSLAFPMHAATFHGDIIHNSYIVASFQQSFYQL